MPIERFKKVEVSGRTYQIGRLTALTGDWVARAIRAGAVKDEETYRKVQSYFLETISYFKESPGPNGSPTLVPMRIYRAGQWLVKELDLEYDLETVNHLCNEVLSFNFDDFFRKLLAEEEAARKAASEGQPASTTMP